MLCRASVIDKMAYKVGGRLVREERIHAGSFKDNKSLQNVIKGCHFIHQLEITMPNAIRIPDFVTWNGDYSEYYIIRNVGLTHLLDMDFIGAFVKTGKIYFLSIGTRIDVDDCAAVIPTGKLILNITKDTYEELGVEGRRSRFDSSKFNKLVVEVDLLSKSFYPGKPSYDKLLKKFEERSGLTFDFLCTWNPNDEEISSRSLCEFFKSKDFKVDVCTNKHWTQCTYSNPTPHISWEVLEGDASSVGYKDFVEWLGAVICEVDLVSNLDTYISTFSCPQPAEVVGQTARTRWTGFLTPSSVQWMLEKLQETMAIHEKVPWIAMTVFGFDDVPTLDNKDHGFTLTNGDNLYTIVLFPNKSYWLYKSTALGTK